MTVVTALCFVVQSPFLGGRQFAPETYMVSERDRVVHHLLDTISLDASAVTQNSIGAHLAARRQIALYPWNTPRPERQVWVFNTNHSDIYPLDAPAFWDAINALRHHPDVRMITQQDGVFIFSVPGNITLNGAENTIAILPEL